MTFNTAYVLCMFAISFAVLLFVTVVSTKTSWALDASDGIPTEWLKGHAALYSAALLGLALAGSGVPLPFCGFVTVFISLVVDVSRKSQAGIIFDSVLLWLLTIASVLYILK